MSTVQLPKPSLQKGWEIFTSRPLSLIVALILSVVLCVISVLILIFPVITAYYYAVRESRREEYFIDFNNILRTSSLVFSGFKKYFFQSYVLGLAGWLPPLALLGVPILLRPSGKYVNFFMIVYPFLLLVAFFLIGALVLFGYPHLLASNHGLASLRYAYHMGKMRKLLVLAVGFILLFPLPGVLFHLLMVFSYPILVASANAATADVTQLDLELPGGQQVTFQTVTLGKLGITLGAAGVMFGFIYLFSWLWGAVGFFIGLILSFVLAVILARRIT